MFALTLYEHVDSLDFVLSLDAGLCVAKSDVWIFCCYWIMCCKIGDCLDFVFFYVGFVLQNWTLLFLYEICMILYGLPSKTFKINRD